MIKDNHADFVSEFKRKLEENRFEFESREIPIDDFNIVSFVDSVRKYGKEHPGEDKFLEQFWNENLGVIGDMIQTDPGWKATHPFSQTLSYKGKAVSCCNYGSEIYDYGVYASMDKSSKLFADQFILPAHVAMKYVEGDPKSREYLLFWTNFQSHRNWTIIWAKTDWIKLAFPMCYEKMMKDGEFLSVEELEEKMKEDKS